MTHEPTRLTISPARRDLIDRSSEAQFGRFENLVIEDGEPRLETPTRLVRTVIFNGTDNPSRKLEADDFALKRPWIELFAYFDRIGTGVIERVDIKAGLPYFMTVEESISP